MEPNIYLLSLYVLLTRVLHPIHLKTDFLAFSLGHVPLTGCTPAEAVFCDAGFTCQSGMAGYTCGELPTAVRLLILCRVRCYRRGSKTLF